MSEINSIANGTFTIGQTSATNFEAGPGISITQPSEGTVRIANDETVLWSGDATSATVYPSEPFSAFQYIGIACRNNRVPMQFYTSENVYNTSNPAGDTWPGMCYGHGWGGKPAFTIIEYASTVSSIRVNAIWHTEATSMALSTASTNSTWGGISKIVGINRISGSNA